MKFISKSDFEKIIFGAELFGTGGGGTVDSAKRALQSIPGSSFRLLEVEQLDKKDIVCTVFGVGATENTDPVKAGEEAFAVFQNIYRKKISAIVPVELGAESIVVAICIASSLGIPLVDGDIVGMRSSPEIFLETISIPNLPRTPCVISDGKGNNSLIYSAKDYEALEKILRNFALSVGGDAFVAGYALSAGELSNVIPNGSVSVSLETGTILEQLRKGGMSLDEFCKKADWVLFGTGKIITAEKDSSKGFAIGKYEIKSEKNRFTVLFKNENLVLKKNGEVILTCPDSISLLTLERFRGVNNFEENLGKTVAILGKKSINIWRTKKGLKLFSPENLGINERQKLL